MSKFEIFLTEYQCINSGLNQESLSTERELLVNASKRANWSILSEREKQKNRRGLLKSIQKVSNPELLLFEKLIIEVYDLVIDFLNAIGELSDYVLIIRLEAMMEVLIFDINDCQEIRKTRLDSITPMLKVIQTAFSDHNLIKFHDKLKIIEFKLHQILLIR